MSKLKIKDPLLSPYEIHRDSYCYIVGIPEEVDIMGKQVISLRNQTYHSSIKSALRKVAELKAVSSAKSQNLKQFVTTYGTELQKLLDQFSDED